MISFDEMTIEHSFEDLQHRARLYAEDQGIKLFMCYVLDKHTRTNFKGDMVALFTLDAGTTVKKTIGNIYD